MNSQLICQINYQTKPNTPHFSALFLNNVTFCSPPIPISTNKSIVRLSHSPTHRLPEYALANDDDGVFTYVALRLRAYV